MTGAPDVDVIIVFGAALAPDGSPGPALRRRIAHAVALWHAGYGRRLLCSGGVVVGTRSEAAVMAGCAAAAGVPPDCIVEEPHSRNTWENAQCCAALMRTHGWTAAALVTERYHLPRARLACRLARLPVRACSGPDHPPERRRWRRCALVAREALACALMLVRSAARALRRTGAQGRPVAKARTANARNIDASPGDRSQ